MEEMILVMRLATWNVIRIEGKFVNGSFAFPGMEQFTAINN